jgi:predicted hotdog family 3-hydroxylacyl-ACP dehydratase
MSAAFPPIEELLPHRGTMLLLDRVLECSAHSASAEYAPRSDAWYADANGDMPSWIGIELMAQTVAVHAGLIKRREGVAPKQGALLGTRRYASIRPAFAASRALRIEATLIYSDGSGFCAYECGIAADGEDLASATLKVFEPDDFQFFLEASPSS